MDGYLKLGSPGQFKEDMNEFFTIAGERLPSQAETEIKIQILVIIRKYSYFGLDEG